MVVINNDIYPSINKYKTAFLSLYRKTILDLYAKHCNHEDLKGESLVIYDYAKYQAIHIYFSLLKIRILTTTESLSSIALTYGLTDMQDNLTRLGFNITKLLEIYEIDVAILN